MGGPIQKVLLVDYDGPLAKNLALDTAAFERLAVLARQGFKIAVITGRTPEYMAEFMGKSEKAGIAGKISLFCEHGCIECSFARGKWKQEVLGRQFPSWKKERAGVKESLNRAVSAGGFEGEMGITIASLFFHSPEEAATRRLQDIVIQTVNKINKGRGAKNRLVAIPSRHGIEVLPASATKSLAAERFLKRIKGPCAGFAFGDRFSDRLMASDKRIKFVPTRSPQQFIQHTGQVLERLEKDLLARQNRMTEARRSKLKRLLEERRGENRSPNTGKPRKPRPLKRR